MDKKSFFAFVRQNRLKIIIVMAIILFLLAAYLLGNLDSGKQINYIPI